MGPSTGPAAENFKNQISGSAGDAVQARDVHGGVHFHGVITPRGTLPQQLPGETRGFVNRIDELAKLTAAAQPHASSDGSLRIVVVAGTAGVGKTSLALRWAHQHRSEFPDGQIFANLRGYDPGRPVTAAEALSRFLLALNVPAKRIPSDENSRSELFRSMVAGRRILVVLDNVATAAQVRPLLPGTSESLVIITSRSRLSGIVAREGARRIHIDVLREHESIALLRNTIDEYRSDDSDVDLAELAHLCADLPLALRVAAERAASRPLMSLHELISDLRDESGLWDALSSVEDDESQSVRSVFAWSYRALPEAAAQLFRRLGLHPSGEFSSYAAAALIGSNLSTAKRLLDVLVGCHLVQESGRSRFQMHDLLRTYAAEQMRLDESAADRDLVVERLFTWYLHAFHASGKNSSRYMPPIDLPPLESILEIPVLCADDEALAWYMSERTNLLLVAQRAARIGLDRIAWQIPATQAEIHVSADPIGTWMEAEREGLAAARRDRHLPGEGALLLGLAISDRLAARFESAIQRYSEAGSVFRRLGDISSEARSENGSGIAARKVRDLARSVKHFTRAIRLTEQVRDYSISGAILLNLGTTYRELQEYDRATTTLRASLEVDRTTGTGFYRTETLQVLASIYRMTGRTSLAHETILEALAAVPTSPAQLTAARNELARIELALSRPEDALSTSRFAAATSRTLANIDKEAEAWGITGDAFYMLGRYVEAVEFHQQASVAHRHIGEKWNLAHDLEKLAESLAANGDRARARLAWMESLDCLDGFSDIAADALRRSINLRLQ